MVNANTITIMVQNLEKGGRKNWKAFCRLVDEIRPDILVLNELTGWRWSWLPGSFAWRAQRHLGMKLRLAPSRSGDPVGIMWRPETVGTPHWDAKNSKEVFHGCCTASFDVGLPQLLTVCAMHINPYPGVEGALSEAGYYIGRALRHSILAAILGDGNYAAAEGPEPDVSKVAPHNLASRMLPRLSPDEPWVADRRVGLKFLAAAFTDVAAFFFRKTGNKEYMEPTTKTSFRLDWALVSPPLVPALEWFKVLRGPGYDHIGLAFALNTGRIDMSLGRDAGF